MAQKMFEKFIGVYPVSKTLRFELRPVGKTQEYIERDGILTEDTQRAKDYIKVKEIIDSYHKFFIDKALQEINLNGLQEYSDLYYKAGKSDAENKTLKKLQDKMRKQISETLKKDESYATIFKKELIKNDLIDFLKNDSESIKIVEGFSNFTTYFTGFHQNRKNMYSDEAKSSAIGFRVVHQNLPKYLDNSRIFDSISGTELQGQFDNLNKSLEHVLKIGEISSYFSVAGFNRVITQAGIDTYNTILGGYTNDSGDKIQGINELINLYNQKNGTKYPKMKPLYKQILSDRNTMSFAPERFENDSGLFDALDFFSEQAKTVLFTEDEGITFETLLGNISKYDLNHIYVKNDNSITVISQYLFGDWSVINRCIEAAYERSNPIGRTKPESYEERKKKELKKIIAFSIGELNNVLIENGYEGAVEKYFSDKAVNETNMLKKAEEAYQTVNKKSYIDAKNSIKRNDDDIGKIKNLLDSFKGLQWLIKPLIEGQNVADKDELFYGELIRHWEGLEPVTPLYNKVRNYVTCKPYSDAKIKLNFGNPELLAGWPVKRESATSSMIFRDENYYYLGIIAKGKGSLFRDIPEANGQSDCLQKMYLYQVADPQKDVQNLMVVDGETKKINGRRDRDGINRRLEQAKNEYLPQDINAIRKERSYSVLESTFSKADLTRYIGYYQERVREYYSEFEFEFLAPEVYKNFGEFTDHVNAQAYQIHFKEISKKYIYDQVDSGCLYLFRIYNKDFSPYSKGRPNLHTLYWKALFEEENLKDVVYKLNGEAEIFYRKSSINANEKIVHSANQDLDNKDPLNDKKTSRFPYDIVKDRRYTCDKFLFHVPITMNFKADKNGSKDIDSSVRKQIHNSKEMHIIGIDRGERNLLYISIIDMEGHIVKQMSLNQLISRDAKQNNHVRDYQKMLVKREKENIESRQNWTTIGSIKELKEGYLSQIIHVLTSLMIEYNAIIVLEDLNSGFKRGRQKFERAVYQKFEKMLIDKLNYLVDKAKKPSEEGGLLKAFQLTSKFESFQKLGKQTGFLFYVPAWNTSKIDPATGFVNLFYTKYESIHKTQELIRKMDQIYYDDEIQCFAFAFDYSNFTYKAEGTQTKWTAYTYGRRIAHFRNPEKNGSWDTKTLNLTQAFKALFEKYNVDCSDRDIRENICEVKEADFYREFMRLFAMMLQMRNSDEESGIDEIVSPVRNKEGAFFVSGERDGFPMDADANGAYNIAKKGLLLIRRIRETDEENVGSLNLAINNKEWMNFAQSNPV